MMRDEDGEPTPALWHELAARLADADFFAALWETDPLEVKRLWAALQENSSHRAIEWNPEAFIAGDFIDPQDPRYAGVAARIDSLLAENHFAPDYLAAEGPGTLQWSFKELLQYRQKLESALTCNDGVLAASGWYALTYYRIQKLNDIIGEQLWIVEDVLAAIISPGEQTFDLDDLIADYGYLDVDLGRIDMEWT